jgi:hypothetical protein
MTFFHDLNKRLAALASKQDAKQLAEEAKATAPKSKLAESMDVAEAGYSAKAGRAGKDLGKPGKNFAKIAKTAGAKYGSKAAGERVAGAVLNKLRHPTEEAATPMTPKQKSFAKLAPPADKITFADKIAGAKKEVDEMLGDVAAEAIKGAIGKGRQQVADEGNAFTGALAKTPKGGKFKVGGKEFTDDSDLEEGFADMDAWLASREKEKGTGKFDRKERTLPGGMKATTYTRRHDDDAEDDSEVSTEPKRRGRPKGAPKGPERTTAKAWKHKGARVAEEEGCVCEMCGQPIVEKAKSQAQQKFMGMVHAAQKGEKPASKEVAKVAKEMPKKAAKDFASTKHKGLPKHVEEESTDKEDQRAEKAGKKVAKDIEYDEGHKSKGDNKAEKAGKKVTKDIEYDDKKDKEEKVDETTVAGSVATAPATPKAGKGMQFGKGVYEGFSNSVESMITESMSVNVSVDDQGKKSINVSATDADADMLASLLKMAGVEQKQQESCGCGTSPCSCNEEELDENSPDWPTNTETLEAEPNLRTYSGGLNGPKSTGQTTTPVIASQLRRQVSMEENVELERSLFKLYKDISGK